MSELEGALRGVAQQGAAAYLAQHAPQRAQQGQQQREDVGPGLEGEGQREGQEQDEQTESIQDLHRCASLSKAWAPLVISTISPQT